LKLTLGELAALERNFVLIFKWVACEARGATWNLGNNSALAPRPRKTTETLDRVGQSQDLPDAKRLLATSVALNTR
jgi:hypothetical protein